mgnify:CR=1 FL=1
MIYLLLVSLTVLEFHLADVDGLAFLDAALLERGEQLHDAVVRLGRVVAVRGVVRGEIVVESLKDKGSDFTVFFQLPLAEEGSIEEKTTTENREQNADNAFRGRRILLGGGLFRRYWMASGECDTGVLL